MLRIDLFPLLCYNTPKLVVFSLFYGVCEMEQILYIIGQGLGIAAIGLGFINYQIKSREQVLYVHILTALCFLLHYLLIGAYSGMSMNFVAAIRDIVYFKAGKNGKVSWILSVGFMLVMGIMGVMSWEAWYSIFVVVGLMINSFAMSFSNPNNVRKSILISSPMVIAYNVFVNSWGGIIYESIVIISSVIGLFRFRKARI